MYKQYCLPSLGGYNSRIENSNLYCEIEISKLVLWFINFELMRNQSVHIGADVRGGSDGGVMRAK